LCGLPVYQGLIYSGHLISGGFFFGVLSACFFMVLKGFNFDIEDIKNTRKWAFKAHI